MSKQASIQFIFPDQQFDNKESFIEAIADLLIEKEEKGPQFYAYRNHWYQDLYNRYGDADITGYQSLEEDTKERINSTIEEVIGQCTDLLPSGDSMLYVFVLPWFPGEGQEVFEGTMGQAPWENTLKLFISTDDFSFESLQETIAHEYNHAIFFQNIPSAKKTILDSIIMEGLAENFREAAVGGEPAAWSTALNKTEVKEALDGLEEYFDAYDYTLYNDIFYGGEQFQRWTGYSVGYQVVKSYLNNEEKIDWEKTMKMNPEDILEASGIRN